MASSNSSTGAVCYMNPSDTESTSNNRSAGNADNILPTAVQEDPGYSLKRFLAPNDQLAPTHPEYRRRGPPGFASHASNRASRQESRRRIEEILGAIDAQLTASRD